MNQLNLPNSASVPVEFLSASFGHVTNSYKFYWFWAILEYLKETQSPIVDINELAARMLAGVWYPTNYFLLSFGKQDRLSEIAILLKERQGLNRDARRQEVVSAVLIEIAHKSPLARQISSLTRYVPTRFLRPFFAQQLKGHPDWKVDEQIITLAEQTFNNQAAPPFYRFIGEEGQTLEIHPAWFTYLQSHAAIVTGFCLWHLLNYLQRNNPNVPNIAGKLFEPEQRDLSNCRKYWRQAFNQLGRIRCIYSGIEMEQSAFSLDHFLPWRFVTHDLMWNIIPTLLTVNAAKSDRLPNWDLYFEPFARLQYTAFQAVTTTKRGKLLEDYLLLFNRNSIQEIAALPFPSFQQALNDTLAPQIQIARNMGFLSDWRY
ncbi:MAG: HNH endonuclease domain-containing protein [Chloroflexota bacterium]